MENRIGLWWPRAASMEIGPIFPLRLSKMIASKLQDLMEYEIPARRTGICDGSKQLLRPFRSILKKSKSNLRTCFLAAEEHLRQRRLYCNWKTDSGRTDCSPTGLPRRGIHGSRTSCLSWPRLLALAKVQSLSERI